MNKLLLLSSFFFLVFFIFPKQASSSHLVAGNLSYENIGVDTYKVKFSVYVDCRGTVRPGVGSTFNLSIESDGGNTVNVVSLVVSKVTEVTEICALQSANTACKGVGNPVNIAAINLVESEVVVYMPPKTDYVLSINEFNRPSGVTNIANAVSLGLYLEIRTNLVAGRNNNSAQFPSNGAPYVNSNQLIKYNQGGVDIDNDSLHYRLVGARSSVGSFVSYITGLRSDFPMNCNFNIFNLDTKTGNLCFNPTPNQRAVITYEVSEFKNGNLICTTTREIQVTTEAVSGGPANTPPVPAPQASSCGQSVKGGIRIIRPGNNLEINADRSSLKVCPLGSDTLEFEITFTDRDNNNVTIFPDMQYLPTSSGIVSNVSGNGTLQAKFRFKWFPTKKDIGVYPFTIKALDDHCLITGNAVYLYKLEIKSSVDAGSDLTICSGDTAILEAKGLDSLKWSVISGTPITPQTFLCDTCKYTWAKPLVTTTYLLQSLSAISCSRYDTLVINVNSDYKITANSYRDRLCFSDTLSVYSTLNTGIASSLIYEWSGENIIFTNNKLSSTLAKVNKSGLDVDLYVEAKTKDGFCRRRDTLTLKVSPNYKPNIQFSNITKSCFDTVALNLCSGRGSPVCGVGPQISSILGCFRGKEYQVGGISRGNGVSELPCPFPGSLRTSKQQYLFLASELIAAGFSSGKIKNIHWNLLNNSNGAPSFKDYKLKIGCVKYNNLIRFEKNLTQVYGSPLTGQKDISLPTIYPFPLYIPFATDFFWDGISNLVIEICYKNTSSSLNNAIFSIQNTAFFSSIINNDITSSSLSACTESGHSSLYKNQRFRPVTSFTIEPHHADTNLLQISTSRVTPTGFPEELINPNSLKSRTYTRSFARYEISVRDTLGNCSDKDTLDVSVRCCTSSNLTKKDILCYGDSTGSIYLDIIGLHKPYKVLYKKQGSNDTVRFVSNILSSDTATKLPAGNYFVQITDTVNCVHSDTIEIVEPSKVTFSGLPDDTICINNSIAFNIDVLGGVGPGVLVFSYGGKNDTIPELTNKVYKPIITTTYLVRALDSLGCKSDIDSVKITVLDSIKITSLTADTSCYNEMNLIKALVKGGDIDYKYNWYDENGNVFSSSLKQDTIRKQASKNGESIKLIVEDGCMTPSDSLEIKIYWWDRFVPTFLSDTNQRCVPAIFKFTNTTNPSLYSSQEWNIGEGGKTFTNTSFSYTYNNPGCYNVSLKLTTDKNCIENSDSTDFVCARVSPIARFNYSPTLPNITSSLVSFNNLSSNNDINIWDFGFPSSSVNKNLENPKVTFPTGSPGDYNVVLKVVTQYGCQDTVLQVISIKPSYSLYVPNSFSPNGDGLNEKFRAYGSSVSDGDFYLKIYNRWGRLIFNSNNINDAWDGNLKSGESASSDTYSWIIQSKDKVTNRIYINKGFLILYK